MTLKSPSGRLARWALQIQSFNIKIDYIPGKSNVVADLLSRPMCAHEEKMCDICMVSIDIPSRNPAEIREEQLKDEDLRKIIESFESTDKDETFATWTGRGYLMNKGILYRYAPDSESEDAQLVVPSQERDRVLKEFHDAPTACHYGAEGTYKRIAQRYYWTGMRKNIADYVQNCHECNRYKASNQKPAGLLQTPVYAQRFETLSIDLFGPLPKSNNGKKWIFIIEDCATKWVELFALTRATAKECAVTMIEEIFLRYGLPRRIISDNGPQFVSAVMQQVCFILDIKQSLTPVYHPQANPVERKNRDLKPRLAILTEKDHTIWDEKLPTIRFALNTAKSDTTGHTAAFLQFGRELRTTDDISHDLRQIILHDNFVPEITPYLRKFNKITTEIQDVIQQRQDRHKKFADQKRRKGPQYKPGDYVWITSHPVSNASQQKTTKFMPRRDGPYVIIQQKSPTSFIIASKTNPSYPIGTYHVSSLKPYYGPDSSPVYPLRPRGRPSHATSAVPPQCQRPVPTRCQPTRKCTTRSNQLCEDASSGLRGSL